MKAFIGWPIKETTLEAMGTKICLLPHLGSLGRFSLARMLTESSLGSDPLGSLERMPFRRDSPCPFQPWGPRSDELYLLDGDPHQ